MFRPETLTTDGIYRISGEFGEWHFLEVLSNKYKFWRWAVGNNQRIIITLSKDAVRRKVWNEVNNLDLSKLEAFSNE